MCILNAASSAPHYAEGSNVDAQDPGIVTSVELPQSPPDSDPGSSPTAVPKEHGTQIVQKMTSDDGMDKVGNTVEGIENVPMIGTYVFLTQNEFCFLNN